MPLECLFRVIGPQMRAIPADSNSILIRVPPLTQRIGRPSYTLTRVRQPPSREASVALNAKSSTTSMRRKPSLLRGAGQAQLHGFQRDSRTKHQ